MHILAIIGIVGLVVSGFGLKFGKSADAEVASTLGMIFSLMFLVAVGMLIAVGMSLVPGARSLAAAKELTDKGCLRYVDPNGSAVATINGVEYQVQISNTEWYCPVEEKK